MMEPTLLEDRKATQAALDAIDYMGIGPRFGIILEAISAARERGAKEEREACAKIADQYTYDACDGDFASIAEKQSRNGADDAKEIADAIRARAGK